MENYHCRRAFEIIHQDEMNIFRKMPKDEFVLFRKFVIQGIINTDMMKHKALMSDIISRIDTDTFTPDEGRLPLNQTKSRKTSCYCSVS